MNFWNGGDQFDFPRFHGFLYGKENGFFNHVLEYYKNTASEVKKQIESANFKINNIPLDFNSLSASLKELFRKNDGYIDENSDDFKYAFWNNAVLQLKRNAPKAADELEKALARSRDKFLAEILKRTENGKEYSGSLREYGFFLCKSGGFFEEPKPMDIRDIFVLACKDLRLSPERAKAAVNKLDHLLKKESLDLNSEEIKKQDDFAYVMSRLQMTPPSKITGQTVISW